MTIREARKQQWEAVKNCSTKEKLLYFWEYYGIKSICLLIGIVVLIGFIVSMVTKKDYAFTGVFFGASQQDGVQQYLQEFGEVAGIDPKEYEISVQCHLDVQMDQAITQEIYDSMNAFATMVAAQSVDSFAAEQDLFFYYGYLGYAADLRTVLTDRELADLAPYVYYIDSKVLEQRNNTDDMLPEVNVNYPDPTKPEAMTDPIPVAISLSAATQAFRDNYQFHGDALIGICASASYPQNAAAFLRYCLGLSQ